MPEVGVLCTDRGRELGSGFVRSLSGFVRSLNHLFFYCYVMPRKVISQMLTVKIFREFLRTFCPLKQSWDLSLDDGAHCPVTVLLQHVSVSSGPCQF